MTRAMKAALLSGLVFPGAGQFYLHHYRRGLTVMTAALLTFIMIMVKAAAATLESLSAMSLAGRPLDSGALAGLTAASSRNIFAGSKLLLLIFIACWVFSVGDAYRLGNKTEDR